MGDCLLICPRWPLAPSTRFWLPSGLAGAYRSARYFHIVSQMHTHGESLKHAPSALPALPRAVFVVGLLCARCMIDNRSAATGSDRRI